MRDDRSSNRSKVPLLGDLPLLGALFRSSSDSKEKTELLVFLTPRVVTNADEARDLTIRKESEAKDTSTPYRKDAAIRYKNADFLLARNAIRKPLQN